MSATDVVHRLTGFNAEGYATQTRCGLTDLEHISAMFDEDRLRGVHWGKAYIIEGRWCARCERSRRSAPGAEPERGKPK